MSDLQRALDDLNATLNSLRWQDVSQVAEVQQLESPSGRDMMCRRSSSTRLAIAVPLQDLDSSDKDLLSPREVAEVFGIRPRTVARWARTGRLSPARTLGGHRRYARAEIRALLGDEVHEKDQSPPTDQEKMEEDAARLYNQGWSIRQVAAQFGFSYSVMHRVLRKHTTLRSRSGLYPTIPHKG